MEDPRFDWNNMDVVRYHEARRLEVATFRASLSSLDGICAALEEWWRGSGRDELARPFELDAAAAGVQALAYALAPLDDAELAALVLAFPGALRGSHSEGGVVDRLAKLLLAETLGRVTAVDTITVPALVAASTVAHHRLDCWKVFQDCFLVTVAMAPERRDAWLRVLQEVPTDIADLIETRADESGIIHWLRDEETEFRSAPIPTKALRSNTGDLRLSDDVRVQLRFLLDLDVREWVHALDRVPSTPVLREIVDCSFVSRDRELLLAAVRDALPAYEGEAPTGNRAVFACVDAMVEHAERLESAVAHASAMGSVPVERAEAELLRLRNTELPEWFRQAYEMILGRPDGERVAFEFAAAMASRTEANLGTSSPAWSAAMAGFEEIIMAFGRHGLTLTRVREVMRATNRTSEMPFLLIGAAVELRPLQSDPPWAMRDDGIRAEAWAWYVDLLLRSDDGLIAHVNPYSKVGWPFPAIGAVLIGAPDPVRTWVTAWTRLFPQREHARFGYVAHLLEPSLHLVRVGVGALEVALGARGTVQDDRMQLLWASLLRATAFLVTGQSGELLRLGPIELGRLFAYLPHVFGAGWREQLDAYWPMLVADERLALRALRRLVRNGVDHAEVISFLEQRSIDVTSLGTAALRVADIDPEPETGDRIEEAYEEIVGRPPTARASRRT